MLRLAVFSPLPPQPSGISDYTVELLPHLSRHAEVDLWVDGFVPEAAAVAGHRWVDFRREPPSASRLREYDGVLYHMGNDPRWHAGIHATLRRIPGIVVLHEIALQHFHFGLAQLSGEMGPYLDELGGCEGPAERERAAAALAAGALPPQLEVPIAHPMNRRLANDAQHLVVHSQWARQQLLAAGVETPISVVPFPACPEREPLVRSLLRADDGLVVVGSFGLVTPEKGVERVLRALRPLRDRYRFHYWIVGGVNPSCRPAQLAHELGLGNRVMVTGHLPFWEFKERIAAVDVAVNLRERTMGETSSSLLRLLGAGLPAVVTRLGSFAELPDACVAKVDLEGGDAAVTAALERLIADPAARARVGAAARAYVLEHHDPARTAEAYVAVVEEALSRRVRRLAARVSWEHAEVGVACGPGLQADLEAVVVGSTSVVPDGDGAAAGERARDEAPAQRAAGRLPPVPGLDYLRGALEYPVRLPAEHRHYLLTKPFLDVAQPPPREAQLVVEGLDEESHRYFCDFAHLARALALPARSRILDLGCGSGWLAEYLARLGYDVTGADVSPDLLDMARERLARVPFDVAPTVAPACRFVELDAERERLHEGFDAVVCYDSLHHFLDARAVLRNVVEMLLPGGVLLVMEGSRPEPGSAGERELVAVMERHATLESPFDRDALVGLFGEAGLTLVGDYVTVAGLFDRDTAMGPGGVPVDPAPTCLLAKKVDGLCLGTTGKPGVRPRLDVRWRLLGDWDPRHRRGTLVRVPVEVENGGDHLWLPGTPLRRGAVAAGLVLRDGTGSEIARRHGETRLPRALGPGERARLEVGLPTPQEAGRYCVELDLVAHEVFWFGERGSAPLRLPLEVA